MLLFLPGPQKMSLEAAPDLEQVGFPLSSVISKTHENILAPAAVLLCHYTTHWGFDVKDLVALPNFIASRH